MSLEPVNSPTSSIAIKSVNTRGGPYFVWDSVMNAEPHPLAVFLDEQELLFRLENGELVYYFFSSNVYGIKGDPTVKIASSTVRRLRQKHLIQKKESSGDVFWVKDTPENFRKRQERREQAEQRRREKKLRELCQMLREADETGFMEAELEKIVDPNVLDFQ